ncbi:radical SAM protein [uncultured Prevotella sp.]|uniref:radical SAM protein n=1 Tax=uncultured Prevotella sp. TaxID=159272 RepID=UPI0026239259|nr:radical SAM protein [uncultured Prevotella sp.]
MGIDGNGITTLVAFMGCPLKCRYCLNDQCHASMYESDGKSLRRGIKMLSPKELYNLVEIDNIYFQATGGGICFGGGEPAMNADFIIEFAKLCPKNWKLTIETSLRCSAQTIKALSTFIDEWIVDVKDMNNSIYENYTKVPSIITEQLQNLKKLVPLDRITIKVPLIPNFNTKADVDSSIGVLKKMGFENIVQITYIERKSK